MQHELAWKSIDDVNGSRARMGSSEPGGATFAAARPMLLNLGCGKTLHAAWVNLDVAPSVADVRSFDIRNPLPFATNTFDAVYHSHLIEHLARHEAATFTSEIFRVLKPNGVVRVATPDLEVLARLYLEKLDRAFVKTPHAADEYDWILLEMFDQVGRERSGGEMADYLRQRRNATFVRGRIGSEADTFWEADNGKLSLVQRIRAVGWSRVPRLIRHKAAALVAGLIGGKAVHTACEAGLFRHSGEVHRLLYDRFSLSRLLLNSGFHDPHACTAKESRIPLFDTYNLDTTPDGRIRKPDSIFMEAIKPATA